MNVRGRCHSRQRHKTDVRLQEELYGERVVFQCKLMLVLVVKLNMLIPLISGISESLKIKHVWPNKDGLFHILFFLCVV